MQHDQIGCNAWRTQNQAVHAPERQYPARKLHNFRHSYYHTQAIGRGARSKRGLNASSSATNW